MKKLGDFLDYEDVRSTILELLRDWTNLLQQGTFVATGPGQRPRFYQPPENIWVALKVILPLLPVGQWSKIPHHVKMIRLL